MRRPYSSFPGANSESVEIRAFIRGNPCVKKKTHGRTEGPKEWLSAVEDQTRGLQLILGPCELEVEFVLWSASWPPDHPHGPDLDNLLKNLMDGLNETVLKDAPGRDGAVIRLVASKRAKRSDEQTGARIVLRPV